MNRYNLFVLILKIIGIFLIKDLIISALEIPQLLFMTFSGNDAVYAGLTTILVFGVYLLVFYLLMFRPEIIIDKLKLEKGFKGEEFSFIKRDTTQGQLAYRPLYTLALLIVSLYLLITEVPNFIRLLVIYYNAKRDFFALRNSDISLSVVSAVKIIIAGMLINSHEYIVDYFLNRKNKNEEEPTT